MEMAGRGRYLGFVECDGRVVLVGPDERTVTVGNNTRLLGLSRVESEKMVAETPGSDSDGEQVGFGGGDCCAVFC